MSDAAPPADAARALPAPLGRDRVRALPQGDVVLDSRAAKGWHARRAATRTSVAHPGTAVEWDGALWEVLEAVPLATGGARYRMAVWDERFAIRAIETYDAASEERRAEARAKHSATARRRNATWWLAPLAGHLPRPVQDDMESELGIPAQSLTLASALPPGIFGMYCIVRLLGAKAGTPLPFAAGWAWLGVYLAMESLLRTSLVLGQNRGFGSAAGTLAWVVWSVVRGRNPFPRQLAISTAEAPRAPGSLEQRLEIYAPLVGMLPEMEQARYAKATGGDPVNWGKPSAVILLILAVAFAGTAVAAFASRAGGCFDALVLAVALPIGAEQVSRLRRLAAGGAAPSVLGLLAVPLVRRLLPLPPEVQ